MAGTAIDVLKFLEANQITVVALTNTAFEGMIGRFSADVRNAVYGS